MSMVLYTINTCNFLVINELFSQAAIFETQHDRLSVVFSSKKQGECLKSHRANSVEENIFVIITKPVNKFLFDRFN